MANGVLQEREENRGFRLWARRRDLRGREERVGPLARRLVDMRGAAKPPNTKLEAGVAKAMAVAKDEQLGEAKKETKQLRKQMQQMQEALDKVAGPAATGNRAPWAEGQAVDKSGGIAELLDRQKQLV